MPHAANCSKAHAPIFKTHPSRPQARSSRAGCFLQQPWHTATMRAGSAIGCKTTLHSVEVSRRSKRWGGHPMNRARAACTRASVDGSSDDGSDDLGGIRIEMFDYSDPSNKKLPTQADSIVRGDQNLTMVQDRPDPDRPPDLSYLQELMAIQENGPKDIGFFGTRNMGFLHQQLIEILSYAMVLTSNHIYTSGATGTNAAVIRGALRAEKPDLLTVVLPQSLSKQPSESQELLLQVKNVIVMEENDDLPLIDASRLCNERIIAEVQQVICFVFHDSNLLLETCREAKAMRKIVTLFYLD
eukprot:CAMPEP_0198213158 /NCGR_PEP_ID=MMETSP1445-20131203/28709_1 /TAXON_ID=36898 /ORGANISM="Pyramimonas sp., Strain CCMP2087" /LENGTH=298 /DNA_ID=CAMNT_0043887769 /DNA_START=142 /DNA_END=1038 /DNA_ORIENTATION=-